MNLNGSLTWRAKDKKLGMTDVEILTALRKSREALHAPADMDMKVTVRIGWKQQIQELTVHMEHEKPALTVLPVIRLPEPRLT